MHFVIMINLIISLFQIELDILKNLEIQKWKMYVTLKIILHSNNITMGRYTE